jgi:hypothetical protein
MKIETNVEPTKLCKTERVPSVFEQNEPSSKFSTDYAAKSMSLNQFASIDVTCRVGLSLVRHWCALEVELTYSGLACRYGRKRDPCPHVLTWVFFAKVMSLWLRTWAVAY